MIIEEDAYLEHFGVKGMKWGVIRQKYRKSRAKSARRNASLQKKVNRMNPNLANAAAARQSQRIADRATRWEKGTPTKADKFHRAASAAFAAGLGGVIVASIISSHGQTPSSRIPHSSFGKSTVEQAIRNEHASQLSSLKRMHQEGKMDSDQFKKFSASLAKRYDRKVAEALLNQ